jgi:hypothetical protein
MQKGYALASLNAGGIYSRLWPESQRVHPDPDKPIVIKMWKLQGAEPLTPIDFDYKTPYTMNPLCFDLIAGSMLPAGGDIRVTVNRPVGVISQQHPQNWSVRLEVIDGGVIMTDGKQFGITYAAPSDGYTSSELVASDNGSEMAHRAFFLKSRNGQVYAKIRFSFRINRLPDSLMYIEFKGIANTNNSRNWEGDPNTMATAR